MTGAAGADDEVDAADRAVVEGERSEVRDFVKSLTPDEIKSGNWFSRLLTQALSTYTQKVDWAYFQEKYKGVPADAIVDQRIKLAARYAAIEGGLSAGAYTSAVAATIGSAGGASPAAVPAAFATVMVDVAYVTQLQIRLAHDIAVLYRVPVDVSDPEDLWKLIRVAFTIKSGEVAREGVVKVVPALVRPLLKRYYSKGVLTAAKSLPIVGRHLLQRNVIKISIPLVGVPLAVVVNRYTTQVAGNHARAVFRNEARLIELANKLGTKTEHPQLLLWVAWLVINADGRLAENQTALFRHLVRVMAERHEVQDEQLSNLVDLDVEDVWMRIAAEGGDLSDVVEAAEQVAAIDGSPNAKVRATLSELERRCRVSGSASGTQ